jgi:hypothetical protein
MRGQAAAAGGCTPLSGREVGSGSRLVGDWRLTLVSSRGSAAGRAAVGMLRLNEQRADLRALPGVTGASMPLIGTADISLEEVGATRVGATSSLDPEAPGVAVIEQPRAGGGAELTLRLGSEANRRGQTRFDGGFMALYVGRIDPEAFYGTWASGETRPESSGHFCAVRQ